MGFGRGVLIVFLCSLIVLSGFVLSFLISGNVLLHEDVYVNAFEKNNVYGEIKTRYFSDDKLSQGLVDISAEGMKKNINSILGGVLAYARGDNQGDGIYINVDNSSIKRFFLKQIEGVGVCNGNQNEFDANNSISCRVAGKSNEQILNDLLERKNMSHILSVDKINLLDTFDKERNIEKLKEKVDYYYYLLYGLTALIIILILIIFIINRDNLKGAFRISGISLLVSELIVFISLKFIDNSLLSKLNLSPDMIYLQNALLDIIKDVLLRVKVFAIIVTVIGLVLIVISLFLKGKSKD